MLFRLCGLTHINPGRTERSRPGRDSLRGELALPVAIGSNLLDHHIAAKPFRFVNVFISGLLGYRRCRWKLPLIRVIPHFISVC